LTVTTPKASVVVRTFNSETTLAACLESLISQTIQPEIIVVDSGSSDGTLSIALRLADRLVRIPRESFSYGGALNRGAEIAAAPVHFAVSSHCVVPRSDWIERALRHYERPDVAGTNGQVTDPQGSPLRKTLFLVANTPTPNPLWGFSNHASSWRADVWRRERFDETLIASEDFEWSDRVLALGFTIVFDPDLTVLPHHYRTQGVISLYRRSKRELLGTAACRPVQPPTLRDALAEWWTGSPAATNRWRQRLSPYRVAVINGRYVAGHKLRRAPARRSIGDTVPEGGRVTGRNDARAEFHKNGTGRSEREGVPD
jgi:rhamnosyltransferase